MSEKKDKKVQSAPIDADVGSAQDVEEVMRKYDRESNVRLWEGTPKLIIRWCMALFMIFMVWVSLFSTWEGRVRRCLFLGLILLFVFVLYPIRKGSKLKVNHMPWYDIILAVVSCSAYFYQAIRSEDLINMGSRIGTLEIVVGIIAILSLVEACRRVVGIPIIVVASAFVVYAMLPGGGGLSLKNVIHSLYYTTDGIIGTPIQVCSTYIFLFILFGSFLEATGIAAFFIDCANSVAGWATGGPAKVAVISSALCGMVSGSSVGNTVTTGSVTIPLMKKTGYPGEFAGAVEAAASTGGQIMPPIMGAAAFLMAEMTGEAYADILVRAILPAALYFTGIFLMVHFKAKIMGLRGLEKSQLPKAVDILSRIYLLLPLIVLVYMVIQTGTFTMAYSAVISTLVVIVVGSISHETGIRRLFMAIPLIPLAVYIVGAKIVDPSFVGNFFIIILCVYFVLAAVTHLVSAPNRKRVSEYVSALENGTKSSLSVAVACGMAGIIAGVVTTTGLGQLIINAIVGVAGEHLIIALVLTMLCCIVLGMGVPTTANYVIMATTCAPILIRMGVPLLAAHFFVFYFGIVADITPPVALAAYAGSAIAKAPPMKTALNATRLAIAAFIIPYIFAFNPALLFVGEIEILEIILVVVTSFCGMFLIAAGLIGYMFRRLNWPLRIICIAGGLALIYPGVVTDIVGLAVLAGSIVLQFVLDKKPQQTA